MASPTRTPLKTLISSKCPFPIGPSQKVTKKSRTSYVLVPPLETRRHKNATFRSLSSAASSPSKVEAGSSRGAETTNLEDEWKPDSNPEASSPSESEYDNSDFCLTLPETRSQKNVPPQSLLLATTGTSVIPSETDISMEALLQMLMNVDASLLLSAARDVSMDVLPQMPAIASMPSIQACTLQWLPIGSSKRVKKDKPTQLRVKAPAPPQQIMCSFLSHECHEKINVDTATPFPHPPKTHCNILKAFDLQYSKFGFICHRHGCIVDPKGILPHLLSKKHEDMLISQVRTQAAKEAFVNHIFQSYGIPCSDFVFKLPSEPLEDIPGLELQQAY
ncbi:hypothetical protein J3A83DRAFT_4381331 [Scleroderma citrinum]